MAKLKILVADDSVVIRRMLVNILSEDPDLEVIGTAPDGEIAMAKIPQTNPDLIILDLEMPNMDGLQTLRAIRKSHPNLPVIMFSSFTQMGAEVTIDALLLGAQDYVQKPSGLGNLEESIRQVKDKLIPKIKALSYQKLFSNLRKEFLPPVAPLERHKKNKRPAPGRVDLVVIGSSTGGPNALAKIFSCLPPAFPIPILIAQHMPPLFTETLAPRLTLKSYLEVKEAVEGEPFRPGMVRLAPGNFHMALQLQDDEPRLKVFQAPLVNSCRPSVDVLFQSAAALYGNRVLGVQLTGMGQDGLKGCEAIFERGGQVLAQDESSSVVWGMPGSVAQAGVADRVLPLEEIAGEILQRVQAERKEALLPLGQGGTR